MTIIHLRGTSGSGKSTIVRRVMEKYHGGRALFQLDRKRPTGYQMHHPVVGRPQLRVIGHYETACGGCDTIPNLDLIYSLVREAHEMGQDVLFEGLLISPELTRTITLHADTKCVNVIALDIPLAECVESIMQRRRAKRGEDAPMVNPRNTEAKWKQTRSAMARLEQAGVPAQTLTREAALARVLELLHVPN